ncbi:unnamed protein product [Effrenium voratum]|nr:unnamed protein product [Effrenium voratum]
MGKLSGTDSLEEMTTIMVRRVPPDMTMTMLLAILDGFAPNKYDFVYLPFDRKKETNIALAFVNFVDSESARKALEVFGSRSIASCRNVRVSSANVQGFATNLAYFLARFGLHALSEPNAPLIFQDGKEVTMQEIVVQHVTPELLNEAMKLVRAERMGERHGDGSIRRAKCFLWKDSDSRPVELDTSLRGSGKHAGRMRQTKEERLKKGAGVSGGPKVAEVQKERAPSKLKLSNNVSELNPAAVTFCVLSSCI